MNCPECHTLNALLARRLFEFTAGADHFAVGVLQVLDHAGFVPVAFLVDDQSPDVGDAGENRHANAFKSLWQEGMSHWLKTAKPGDVLPFTPELGPPSSGYSITYRDKSGQTNELSDRWE